MKNNRMFRLLLVAVPIIMLTSCNKQAKDEAARVKFNITDAPAACDALNIDVQSIMVHTETAGWVSLQSSLGVINILDYVNGETAVIAEGEIAAGNIDQVSLVLGSNNSVVVNGVCHTMPNSGNSSQGLIINLNTTLEAQGNYEWTIDFDAAQSVIATASGAYEFRPAIRLVVNPVCIPPASVSATVDSAAVVSSTGGSVSGSSTTSGSATGNTSGTITVIGSGSGSSSGSGGAVVSGSGTGNISGSISSAIGIASVCCTCSDGSTVCTMTDITGHFTLLAISSGTCSIQIDPVLPLISVHTVSNISVAAGQTTNVGCIAL